MSLNRFTSLLACGNLCVDCYGTADNCTSCKFENTSPPLCGCISSDYFMLSNYSCESKQYVTPSNNKLNLIVNFNIQKSAHLNVRHAKETKIVV